jgi:hypothetical protein
MMPGTYFVEDEPALARRLDDYLSGLAHRLGQSPAAAGTLALVLSGGYGRGEGGVYRDEAGQADLYNDLEFYMLLRDPSGEQAARAWCEHEEPAGTLELGIDVEIKRLPIGELKTATPSMFYYDLVIAHQLVWGDASWLDELPAGLDDAAQIPLAEATRLMFNRGSGLFYGRCALARNDDRVDDGFVARNQAKVRLALGDAVLAANGRYHHFARERNRRVTTETLEAPPDWEQLQLWHTEGVDFKLHPRHHDRSSESLQDAQPELATAWLRTFLWLEQRRLGRQFATAADYANAGPRLYPRTSRLRNGLLHLRDLKNRGGALPGWWDYPRAALQRALVQLVDPSSDPDPARVSRALGLSSIPPHWTDLESAYARWWAYYN